MGNKLYVANLAFHLTEHEITDIFSPAGTVQEVKLILDKITGKSRGFAFVTMASDSEAEKVITEMNGHKIEGRPLAITEARPREERPPGFRPAASGGGNFRPNPAGASSVTRPAPASNFGQDRPPFSAGGRSTGGKDRSNPRSGDPRREKEKPRGPRPMRNFEDDDEL